MAFSRHREFRADAMAGELLNRGSMIGALQTLQQKFEPFDAPNGLATAKIADGKGMFKLWSSHPPIEARIEALRRN